MRLPNEVKDCIVTCIGKYTHRKTRIDNDNVTYFIYLPYIKYLPRISSIYYKLFKRYYFTCYYYTYVKYSWHRRIKHNIYTIKKFTRNQYQFTMYIMDIALEYDQLNVIKWLHKHYDDYNMYNYDISYMAMCHGNIDIVKYLHSRGGFGVEHLYIAACRGYLDIIKYFHANGVKIRDNILFRAADNGHLHVVKWYCENHFDLWNFACAILDANIRHQTEIEQYLKYVILSRIGKYATFVAFTFVACIYVKN